MDSHEAYIGLMSGTSMDGIDAVLATFEPAPRVLRTCQYPWPRDVLKELRLAASGEALPAARLARLDSAAGEVFASAALEVAKDFPGNIRAVGSHGQTLSHDPEGIPSSTLQIGNPAIVAERTGITAVADFRRRDIAAGGQGAPLVPAFHAAFLRSTTRDRIVLNIGGIANITTLPKSDDSAVTGFDTGPGNCLMDAWMRKTLDRPFDRDGELSRQGKVHPALLTRMLSDPYFSRETPKSTGVDYFSLAWVEQNLRGLSISPEDVQATLAALTVNSIATAVLEEPTEYDQVLVCGGGVHNPTLMEGLDQQLACPVESTEVAGIDPDWVEALAFAWLARETLAGRAANVPAVTGASGPRILGAIYPA